MSARDVVAGEIDDMDIMTRSQAREFAAAILAALHAMPAADRITLARALVPPGYAVAKVPEPKKHIRGMDESACGVVIGWNACRAAFIASSEGTP